jgi:hypothetical protein
VVDSVDAGAVRVGDFGRDREVCVVRLGGLTQSEVREEGFPRRYGMGW